MRSGNKKLFYSIASGIIIIVILLLVFYLVPNMIISKLVINKLSKIDGAINFYDKNRKIIFKCYGSGVPVNVRLNVDQDKFFHRLMRDNEVGLGESYVEKWWDCDDLFQFLFLIILNNKREKIASSKSYWEKNTSMVSDRKNISRHYDESNYFFMLFLKDPLSAYTCGFWKNENDTLENAQFRKVNYIIRKMNLKPNSEILDIGCGWGKICNYIARKTKSHCTGVTISREQERFIKENLDPRFVSVINQDYRLLEGQYDGIYSIGMFEHVRHENMDSFFKTIQRVLKPSGRFVLHTIVNNFNSYQKSFCTKHVFPGGQVPQVDWIEKSCTKNGLCIMHAEIFGGQHYARTLRAWYDNLMESEDIVRSQYSEALLRKYQYYFKICEAAFITNHMSLGHFVITKNDYVSLNNSFVYDMV